jgi:hypothetical protein
LHASLFLHVAKERKRERERERERQTRHVVNAAKQDVVLDAESKESGDTLP